MKLTTFLLLACMMTVSAATKAQQVTINLKNASLETLFTQLEKQTGYDFVYDEQLIQNAKTITLKLSDVSLDQVLTTVLQAQPLTYILEGKVVTIKQKESNFLDKFKSAIGLDKIDVTGKIVGDDNQPLSGATVTLKGANNSTITDAKGLFTLKSIDPNATLIVSYIGYEKTIISAKADLGTIKLKVTDNKLDEVQVIAYGQTSERLNTGDVTTITAKSIGDQPVQNPLLALEGQVPGLFINQQSGLPGSGVQLTLQGQNSIYNSSDPFYVVDGVPYSSELLPNLGVILGTSGAGVGVISQNGNPLNFLNPSDIESISVLRDADATAIYGSRAANGAILIITKKGKAGQVQANVSLQQGWGQVTRMLDLLNTPQYLQMRRQALANDGLTGPASTDYDINGTWDTTRYTNWQKLLIGNTAYYSNFNGSVSGGGNNTSYLVSATYRDQTTVFPGQSADQSGAVHFNLNSSSPNEKFHIQLTGNYQTDDNRLPLYDLTNAAISLPPDAPPIYNKNGTLNWMPNSSGSSTWANPLAILTTGYTNKTENLIADMVLSYEILTGLKLNGNFGYNDLRSAELVTTPLISFAPEQRSFLQRNSVFGNNDINSWTVEPQLNYQKHIYKGTLDLLAGLSAEQSNSTVQQIAATGFNSDNVLGDIASAATLTSAGSQIATYKYIAVFGRLNYNWEDKYLIDMTARRDGSSRFGADNQFHDFWAIGAGWIFSNEKAIKDGLPFLSYGKLRSSYGTTGSDQIGDYQYISLYNPIVQQVPYQGGTAIQPSSLANPYIQWEQTNKLDFGLDLGFLKDRVLINATYFRNRSSNQLLGYNLPIQTGFPNILENFPATVQNSGWEFSLTSTNIKTRDFKWTTSFNLTIPENKLLAFPDLASSAYAQALVIGQPITIYKVFHYLGVNPQTGLYQFASAGGGATSNPNPSTDQTYEVNRAPKFYGGLSSSFTYKKFELDLLFAFTKRLGPSYQFGDLPGGIDYNQPVSVLESWEKPGDVKPVQRFSSEYNNVSQYYDLLSSDGGFQDASYIRLKNCSLYWSLPDVWVRKCGLRNGRLFINGQNLLTITRYSGLDPETLNVNGLPTLKVLMVGINAGF